MANETVKKTLKTRIKLKRDTSANWEKANPVLLNGETIIVDTANNETRTKTGDGTKTYTQLPFDDEGTKGGKGLSTCDYTAEDKAKVAKIKNKVNTSDVLTKINTTEFTPTTDYQPATKKYVDDSVSSAGSGDMLKSVYDKDNDGIIDDVALLQYYGTTDITISDSSYFTVNSTGETITGLTNTGKTQTKLVIPYKINGVEIASIGEGAFSGSSLLKLITIPNSVTSIGNGAFGQCSSLTSINIPNSVISIGHMAFIDCKLLTSINIPNSVTSIYTDTFRGCSGLKSLYCEQGSYAETCAKDNNIPIVYTDIKDDVIHNLSEKVDKVEGKSLIDKVLADNVEIQKPGPDVYAVQLSDKIQYFELLKANGQINVKGGLYIGTPPTKYVGISNGHIACYGGIDSYGGAIVEHVGDGAEHKLTEKAEAKTYTVSVPTTSWTEKTDTDNQKYYYRKITVSGMTASGQAMTDVAMSDSVATARKEMEAYQCVNRVVTGDGYVELYCFDEIPTTTFTLKVLVLGNTL